MGGTTPVKDKETRKDKVNNEGKTRRYKASQEETRRDKDKIKIDQRDRGEKEVHPPISLKTRHVKTTRRDNTK